MADIIDNRVNEAQAQLAAYSKRLEFLIKSAQGKQQSGTFRDCIRILEELIKDQSEIIDSYNASKNKNGQIYKFKGNTSQLVNPTINAMGIMLNQLEKMVR